MSNETIKTHARTTRDGMLNLSVNVGLADCDVAVVVQVSPLALATEVDKDGWPKDFFALVPGSMPDLERASQLKFEERVTFD